MQEISYSCRKKDAIFYRRPFYCPSDRTITTTGHKPISVSVWTGEAWWCAVVHMQTWKSTQSCWLTPQQSHI